MTPHIVYGPQGCGKTQRVHDIAKALGIDTYDVVDDWDGKSHLPDGALALTNLNPPYADSAAGCLTISFGDLALS